MIKWLYEVVYALIFKKHMKRCHTPVTFVQALRFVRCDFLIQKEICDKLGLNEEKSGKVNSDEKEQDH